MENIESIITEKTTKYYYELKTNYKNLFNNDYTLLATAGVLDAQHYVISEKSIKCQKIIELSKSAIESENDSLTDFIWNLIILLQSIDYPEYGIEDIALSKSEIKEIIDETLNNYVVDSVISSEVNNFINHDYFNSYRLELEIDSNYTNSNTTNLLAFLVVVIFCFGLSLLTVRILSWNNIIGYLFSIIPISFVFFNGKYLVNLGGFRQSIWKPIFVLFLPVILLIDYELVQSIEWYNMYGAFGFYLIFTLRFLITKVKRYN